MYPEVTVPSKTKPVKNPARLPPKRQKALDALRAIPENPNMKVSDGDRIIARRRAGEDV